MSYWEALGLAAGGVFLVALTIGMAAWSGVAWMDGDWWEKALNLVAWILIVAFIIWRLSRIGGPA